MPTPQVFLDISLDGEKIGRIVMGLYGKQVPKTAWEPVQDSNDVKSGFLNPFNHLMDL